MDDKTSTKRIEPSVSRPKSELQQLAELREAVATPRGAAALEAKSVPCRGAEIVSLEPVRRARAVRTFRKPAPKAPAKVRIEEHIGRQLKTLYDDVLSQPIPDRFLDLLRKLDSRESDEKDRR